MIERPSADILGRFMLDGSNSLSRRSGGAAAKHLQLDHRRCQA
jgi:hypothetical protein